MRLATLLAELPVDQLERLAAEHLGQDETLTPATLCATLESVLKSYSFVRRFICNRMAPGFAALELLLDTDGAELPAAGFRDQVLQRTSHLCERVAQGDLVGREDTLRVYRRVLYEARRNDLEIDASESAILGVLRRELGVRPVEHFLVEHHADFQAYWGDEHAFLRELSALRSSGLLFGHDSKIVIAEEAVPLVRQALGLEMAMPSRRRLYEQLSGQDIGEVLAKCGFKSSGAREEKRDRLLASYVQPTEVLRHLALPVLKELCRDVDLGVSGSKDELVGRLVSRHARGLRELEPEVRLAPPLPPEPRDLDATRFRALFLALRGDELTDILVDIESPRVSGAKDVKVELLLASPRSERGLLECLSNKALEEISARLGLRTSGAKSERASRIVKHFADLDLPTTASFPLDHEVASRATGHVHAGTSAHPKTY